MQAHRSAPLAIALLAAGAAAAQEGNDAPARAPERCVILSRVERTEVIDDRTLIFHMRGGGIYLNYLSRECPGLKREERFMYSPTSNRLCDIDTVTVLEQWGFGLTRGFTCTLGQFHPISELDLQDLRRSERAERPNGEGEFEVTPVDPDTLDELGRDGAAESATDESAAE